MKGDDKLWKVFSMFIRLRDVGPDGYGKCFTCSRIIHWTRGDCGHGIPRQHKATKFNERNNHLQCKTDNGFQGGMREAYKSEMDRRYGENSWDLMQLASRQLVKRGQFEIDVLTKHYKELVELEKKNNPGKFVKA